MQSASTIIIKSVIMKKLLLLICLFTTLCASAQSDADKVLQRVQELTNAIFSAKDSAVIDGLLAEEVTYGHSSGKIENRQEMIQGAVHSGLTFSNIVVGTPTIFFQSKAAIVRHEFTANAVDAAGKQSVLHIGVLQVWVKQKGNWKLTARQAVKI